MLVICVVAEFSAESRMLLQLGVGPMKASRYHSEYDGHIDYFKNGWQTGMAIRWDFFIFSMQIGAKRIVGKYRYLYYQGNDLLAPKNVRLFQSNEVTSIPVVVGAGIRPLAFLDSWPLQFYFGAGYQKHYTKYHFLNMYPVYHNNVVDRGISGDGFDEYLEWPSEKKLATSGGGVFFLWGLELRSSPKTLLSLSVMQGSVSAAEEEDKGDYRTEKRTKEMVLLEDWLWQGRTKEEYDALEDVLEKMKIRMVSVSLSVAFR